MRRWLVVAASAIACCSWASTPNGPAKSKVQPANSAQGQSDHYPTENAPFPVQVIEPPSEASHAKEREDNTDQNERANLAAAQQAAAAAAWSAWIALGGTVVAALALWFLVKTYRETRRAANAAEQTLTQLERPWLILESVAITRREPPPVPNAWFISFHCKNVGRAPALCEEFVLGIEDGKELPDAPDYSKAQNLGCQRIVAPGEVLVTQETGPGDPKRMKDGKEVFFVVFCRLRYRSLPGGAEYESGFAVEVSPHMPVSSMYRNKNYEFYT